MLPKPPTVECGRDEQRGEEEVEECLFWAEGTESTDRIYRNLTPTSPLYRKVTQTLQKHTPLPVASKQS